MRRQVPKRPAYHHIRIDHLEPGWIVVGVCFRCRHRGDIDRADLYRARTAFPRLALIAAKIRCKACGFIGANVIELEEEIAS